MADRIQALASEKGISLRDFSLVAGGGAGPLHAVGVAEELGIRKVIVPPRPGAFSALGLLCSDVIHDYVWTSVSELETSPIEKLNEQFESLETQALQDIVEEGLGNQKAQLFREADVRYVGQGFELRVPVKRGSLTHSTKSQIRKRFETLHKRLYGHVATGEPVEIVSFRLRAVVRTPKYIAGRSSEPEKSRTTSEHVKRVKPMWFGDTFLEGRMFQRSDLTPGTLITGPAVIYQQDSTTVIPPQWSAEIDMYENIVIGQSR